MSRLMRVAMAILAIVGVLIWSAVLQEPDGRLHVLFLDVASGQGIIVRTPTGHVIVVDGGPSPSELATALGGALPFWQRTIDLLVATHQGSPAIQPLIDISQRYSVEQAIGPVIGDRPTQVYEAWRTVLARRRIYLEQADSPLSIDAGDGVHLDVQPGDKTLALRLSFGQISLLLPGPDGSPAADVEDSVIAFPASANSRLSAAEPGSTAIYVLMTGKKGSLAANQALPADRVFSTATLGPIELVSDGHHVDLHAVR